MGINAELEKKEIKKPDPYFCFVNPSKYDVVESGRKIAGNVTYNKADQDDLLQEGWLYLWKNREKLENETISYVLMGCYFRFIDYLKQGSSIDSKSRENVTVISLYCMSDEGQAPFISNIPSRIENAKDVLIPRDLKEQIQRRLNAR